MSGLALPDLTAPRIAVMISLLSLLISGAALNQSARSNEIGSEANAIAERANELAATDRVTNVIVDPPDGADPEGTPYVTSRRLAVGFTGRLQLAVAISNPSNTDWGLEMASVHLAGVPSNGSMKRLLHESNFDTLSGNPTLAPRSASELALDLTDEACAKEHGGFILVGITPVGKDTVELSIPYEEYELWVDDSDYPVKLDCA